MSVVPRIASVLGIALALAAPARGGGVVIVGGQAGVGYADVQSAIAAAVDGDVLLVADGTYPGFTLSNKSLSIFAAPGASVKFADMVQIDQLAAGRLVVLSGFSFGTGPYQYPQIPTALFISNSAGQVRVQACTVFGQSSLSVYNSPHVAVSKCILQAGQGIDDPYPFGYGGYGGVGLSSNCEVAVYDCQIAGGVGGSADNAGGGGPGVSANPGAIVYIFHSSIQGGAGGASLGFGQDGSGGPGVRIEQGATVRLLDSAVAGGAGGSSGIPGPPFFNLGGTLVQLPGVARTIASAALLGDASGSTPFIVTGVPGDRVFLMTSTGVGWSWALPFSGYWLVPFPPKMSTVPLGTIGAAGVLNKNLTVPDLGLAASKLQYARQCLVRDTQGQSWLTGPVEQLVYAHHGAPDCDNDGLVDFVDCLQGLALDCNGSLVPDACEISAGTVPDCNLNGTPDSCDIADGSSTDANANGIPDECENLGSTVYVDASAPPGGNGSAGAPFQNIQDGVDLAFAGMTVLVRDGVYTGARNRGIDFQGKDIVVLGEHGPSACVIDCQQLGRAFRLQTLESLAARVEGFTIANGRPIPDSGFLGTGGGAIWLDQASLTVAHCVFTANCTGNVPDETGGGAIMAYGADLAVEECSFTDNLALSESGGAIKHWFTSQTKSLSLRGCTFSGNRSRHGGAVFANAASVVVSRCTFVDNGSFSATQNCAYGGAMNCWAPSLVIADCLFAGNRALWSGGAVYAGASLTLANSTFAGNACTHSASTGGALALGSNGSRTLSNCILWGDSAVAGPEITIAGGPVSIAYCDVAGGQAAIDLGASATVNWGAGRLALDPQFVDPDGADNDPLTFLDNVYRLRPTSPCIDAGDNLALPPDLLDLDGDGNTSEPLPLDINLKPRRADVAGAPDVGNGTAPFVDMGAYERQF